jgi:hypothetical protein
LTTILLDAADTNRRLVQQVVPLAGAILIVAGLAVAGRSTDASRLFGGLAAGFGAGLLVAAARPLIHWDLAYKGHIIRFENHSVLGERLYIDGERISSGPFGYRKTLQGVIKSGDGAGDRITSESEAGVLQFRCRIVAESAAPASPRQ